MIAKKLLKQQLGRYRQAFGGRDSLDPALSLRLIKPLEEYAACRQWQTDQQLFASQVVALQQWQTARILQTHETVLTDSKYASAARFLLIDAYQSTDLTTISSQIEQAVPYMVKLFPDKLLSTIEQLLQLNLVTAQLDEALAGALFADDHGRDISQAKYLNAFKAVDGVEWRFYQLELMQQLIGSIECYVKNAWLMRVFKWAKGPAYSANFSTLYDFLHRGLTALASIDSPSLLAQEILTVERLINQKIADGAAAPFMLSERVSEKLG